jgi:signal transduction histidine kinase
VVLNAVDAMPAGGTLTLRSSELDGKIRVEIADTGNGLTSEESARLFTPYYTTKPQGTGLGLAIVQSVVSDHQGTVSISSEEGRGTTIRIELPQRQLDRPEIPRDEVVTAKNEPSTPTTLAAASD